MLCEVNEEHRIMVADNHFTFPAQPDPRPSYLGLTSVQPHTVLKYVAAVSCAAH